MSFNLQAVTGWLSVPVQTVTTTFLPTLGGKKETHFRRVLVDQFSKFQKMSSPMNQQNQLLSEQNFFGHFITHLTRYLLHVLISNKIENNCNINLSIYLVQMFVYISYFNTFFQIKIFLFIFCCQSTRVSSLQMSSPQKCRLRSDYTDVGGISTITI